MNFTEQDMKMVSWLRKQHAGWKTTRVITLIFSIIGFIFAVSIFLDGKQAIAAIPLLAIACGGLSYTLGSWSGRPEISLLLKLIDQDEKCINTNRFTHRYSYTERSMKNSKRSVFRQGFIFGFGLIVPLAVGYIGYSFVSYKVSDVFFGKQSIRESKVKKREDNIKNIEIQNFHDTREGDSVMVIGSIKNIGKEKIGYIQIEAEFFNSKGEFVYEEIAYISREISSNEVENFVIKSGNTNRKIPEYEKITVRVVHAGAY